LIETLKSKILIVGTNYISGRNKKNTHLLHAYIPANCEAKTLLSFDMRVSGVRVSGVTPARELPNIGTNLPVMTRLTVVGLYCGVADVEVEGAVHLKSRNAIQVKGGSNTGVPSLFPLSKIMQ
jgi:hypothetical protein